MSIEIRNITDEQKDRILNISEGHFYELKAKEIQPRKLTKTITAFANSDGGEVYVGIGEVKEDGVVKHRSWNGFANQEEANGHLQIFTELFPFGTYFVYEFLKSEDDPNIVLHIAVNKTSEITKASDGIPYIRKGAQNIPIKTLEEFIQVFGEDRRCSVSRELTKMFEENKRGTLKEISEYFKQKTVKGEIVIVVEGKS